MMRFSDILTLAKQGYKPSDIKELIELAYPEEKTEEKPEEKPDEKTEEKQDEPKEDKPEEPKEEKSDEPDYKKLYEDLKKEQQRKNVRQNGQTEEKKETIEDVFRKMM